MIAFGRIPRAIRQDCWEWRSSQDVFQWTSPDSIEGQVAEMAEADEESERDLVGRRCP